MVLSERAYGVWLNKVFVGYIHQRGDHCRFALHPSYADDPGRPVLGLTFEQDLAKVHSSALRLPPWFSNLLPEGRLRSWMAETRGVSEQREMELLGEIGHDLPGAVRVMAVPPQDVGGIPDLVTPEVVREGANSGATRGRFSLAGVQLKLSMVAAGDRLVVPLGGAVGDWIVKFPDAALPNLPVVEHATMELARRAGIDVPETRLLTRDELPDTPGSLWQNTEDVAFAIRRFDRLPSGLLVHIEDLAQVKGVWPDQKYEGSYEALAGLIHRGHDEPSLLEMVRRVAFNVLVDNSDAHLKNWSLRYADPRRPVLSPAYDVVSVAPYAEFGGDTALKLGGSRRADQVRLRSFEGLGRRVDVDTGILEHQAAVVVAQAVEAWPEVAEAHLPHHPGVRSAMGDVIAERARTLHA